MSSGPTGIGPNAVVARFSLLDHAAFITPGVDTPFLEALDYNGTTSDSRVLGFRFLTSTNTLHLRNPGDDWTQLITAQQVSEGYTIASGNSSGTAFYLNVTSGNNILSQSLESNQVILSDTVNSGGATLIGQFSTALNVPGATLIPAGIWQIGF